MEVTYSHCIGAVRGQLDCAPYTRYVLRVVVVDMYRWPPDQFDPIETFTVDYDGLSAWGYTPEECVSDLRYKLMDRSRSEALAAQVAA